MFTSGFAKESAHYSSCSHLDSDLARLDLGVFFSPFTLDSEILKPSRYVLDSRIGIPK